MLESPFNKVAGLQDCWETYLLHAHLRFYFSLGKTLKKINQTMFTEAYYEQMNIYSGVFVQKQLMTCSQ